MKARIRPVGHPDNVTVFNEILAKVIHVVSKVKVIAYLAALTHELANFAFFLLPPVINHCLVPF
jgi:hypothetical protein